MPLECSWPFPGTIWASPSLVSSPPSSSHCNQESWLYKYQKLYKSLLIKNRQKTQEASAKADANIMESWELRYPLVTWPGKHLNHAEEKGCNKNYDDYFNLSSIAYLIPDSWFMHCISNWSLHTFLSTLKHYPYYIICYSHKQLKQRCHQNCFCRTIIIPLKRSPYINTKLFNITLMISGHRPAPGLKTYSVPDLTKTRRPTLYISLQTLRRSNLNTARSFQRASSSQTNG